MRIDPRPAFVLLLLLPLVLAGAVPAAAQAIHPRVDLFAGYSLLPANGDDFPRETSHGIQASAAVHVNRWFGVFGEVGAHFDTRREFDQPAFQGLVARSRVVEWLTGPRFTARSPQADVFVHGLFGISNGDAGDFAGFSDSGVTFGGGGGVDVRVHPRAAVRVQFDWIGSFADIVEANTRLAVGGVWFFGAK